MAYLPVFEPPPMVVEPDALRHASHDVHHVLLVHRHLEAVQLLVEKVDNQRDDNQIGISMDLDLSKLYRTIVRR